MSIIGTPAAFLERAVAPVVPSAAAAGGPGGVCNAEAPNKP